MPIHWTDQFASAGRVDALLDSATDPWSGQPGLKNGRVSVRRFDAAWYGFAVLADRPRTIAADYWALARAKGGWRIELAGAREPDDWDKYAAGLLDARAGQDVASYRDRRSGAHRFAVFDGDCFAGTLFVSADPVAVSRALVAGQLGTNMPPERRWRHLAGRAGADGEDRGAILCSCFEIGDRQIADAVLKRGCTTVGAVGMALGAGTNCGSCRPEIRRVIEKHTAAAEPEPA